MLPVFAYLFARPVTARGLSVWVHPRRSRVPEAAADGCQTGVRVRNAELYFSNLFWKTKLRSLRFRFLVERRLRQAATARGRPRG